MPMVKGVMCDRCGRTSLQNWTKGKRSDTEKTLRAAGWRIGKRTLCPVCVEATRPGATQRSPDEWYCPSCKKWMKPGKERVCGSCGEELVPF